MIGLCLGELSLGYFVLSPVHHAGRGSLSSKPWNKAVDFSKLTKYCDSFRFLKLFCVHFCWEGALRDFCDFDKVPDGSYFTRFKQRYCDYLADMFHKLVDITEPICHEIDSKKADYLIFDTTGIEPYVAENNPKFLNTKHWDNLYNHRVYIERTIFLLKDCFGLNTLRTQNTTTIKADVYLAAITQLIGVILAKSIHELKLFKSIRKLVKQAA